MCAILANLLVTPYILAFTQGRFNWETLLLVILMDLFCIGDIVWNLFLRGFVFNGHLVVDKKEIWRRYCAKDLIWDIFTYFPMDYIEVIVRGQFGLIRLQRLLAARRLNSILNKQLGLVVGHSTAKLVKLVVWFALATHCIASLYFTLCFIGGFGDGFAPDLSLANSPQTQQYMSALVYALKVFAWKGPPVSPHTTIQFAFTNAMVCFGLFASAYSKLKPLHHSPSLPWPLQC